LAFSAIQNNDKVGVIFFSNKIEKYIPPKKGKKHVLLIIRELVHIKASEYGTDLTKALEYFNNIIKRRSIVFIMSDFLSDPYTDALRIVKKKHDVIGLHLYDKREKELPDIGLVQMQDIESNQKIWVDTSSTALRSAYQEAFEKNRVTNEKTFHKVKADFVSLETEQNYASALLQLFKTRGKRR
jgi:uncharacterized protein (DUF58 family)